MIHEDHVHRRAADRAQHRDGAGGEALGGDHAEPRHDLGDEAVHDRRRRARRGALEQRGRRVAGELAQERAGREIADVHAPLRVLTAERENLDAGEPRLELGQILAIVACGLGDGAQHQCRGQRQLDR